MAQKKPTQDKAAEQARQRIKKIKKVGNQKDIDKELMYQGKKTYGAGLRDHLTKEKSTDRLNELSFKNSTIKYLDEARKTHFPHVDSAHVMNNKMFNKVMKAQKSIDSLNVASKNESIAGKAKNYVKKTVKQISSNMSNRTAYELRDSVVDTDPTRISKKQYREKVIRAMDIYNKERQRKIDSLKSLEKRKK